MYSVCVCVCVCAHSIVSDSLPPHGLYNLPGSSVHGVFQARMLEGVAISFSRAPSWPRNWTWVSCVSCDTWEACVMLPIYCVRDSLRCSFGKKLSVERHREMCLWLTQEHTARKCQRHILRPVASDSESLLLRQPLLPPMMNSNLSASVEEVVGWCKVCGSWWSARRLVVAVLGQEECQEVEKLPTLGDRW